VSDIARPSRGYDEGLILSRDSFCIGIVLLGTLLNAFPRRSGPIDMRWDAAQYYVLGTSLAAGHGYRVLSEPGEIEEVQYPPGTPALIALHEILLGTAEPARVGPWLKLSWLLMYAALCVLTYALARELAPPWLACLAALLVAFNVPVYVHSAQCSSDLPYALVSSAFILVVRKASSKRAGLAAAALAVTAYFLRTVGVVLFAAWIFDGLLGRLYRRAALRIGLAAICILVWNAHVSRVESSEGYRHPAYSYQTAGYQLYNVSYSRNMAYVDTFHPELGIATPLQLMKRFVANAALVPKVFGESVSVPISFWTAAVYKLHGRYPAFPNVPRIVFSVPTGAMGMIVIAGIVMLLWRGERLIAAYIAITAAAIAATPWPDQMSRYAMALTPFLIFALLFLALKTSSKARTGLFVAAMLTVQCFMYLLTLKTYSIPVRLSASSSRPVEVRHLFFDHVSMAIEDGLSWIGAHSRPADIIAMTSPQVGFLRTGHKTVMPPLEIDHALANDLLKAVPIRYLLLERNQATWVWKYMWPVVSGYPNDWTLVFRAPGDLVLVYECSSSGR
jgi:hypothetical protein